MTKKVKRDLAVGFFDEYSQLIQDARWIIEEHKTSFSIKAMGVPCSPNPNFADDSPKLVCLIPGHPGNTDMREVARRVAYRMVEQHNFLRSVNVQLSCKDCGRE